MPERSTVTLYGIPNCDTVRRARAWLAGHGIEPRWHDLRRDGVPADALPRWLASAGRERLLNRQGTTWRRLEEALRAKADDDAGVLALLAAQPTLIRRPVVEWPDGRITVGFDEADWTRRLPGA